MDKETIKENYANLPTEDLLSLVKEIKSLNPNFLTALQSELINRNENEAVLKITEYLVSIKYYISDRVLFDNMLSYKRQGLSKEEIDNKLKEKHGINSDYSDLLRISLKEKGIQNIVIGSILSIITLVVGIILLSMKLFVGVYPLIFFFIGIWNIKKGIEQKSVNN